MEGKLHSYYAGRHLNLFEFITRPQDAETDEVETPPNVLLFVGGMFDNFDMPGYVSDFASLFPRHKNQKWGIMHVQLSSAMGQFGFSDLDRDTDEIGNAITYIRQTLRHDRPTNVVLMGHSTGCQDTLHYLHTNGTPDHESSTTSTEKKSNTRPTVQGAILQAAISDRDMLNHMMNTEPTNKELYDKCMQAASATAIEDHRHTILPLNWTTPFLGPAPLSISRFLSLFSPESPEHPSADDKFSFDLAPEALGQTFGKIGSNGVLVPASPSSISTAITTEINTASSNTATGTGDNPAPPHHRSEGVSQPRGKQILILLSEADEYYPPEKTSAEKQALLNRWADACLCSSSPSPSLPSSSLPSQQQQEGQQEHSETTTNATDDTSVKMNHCSKLIPNAKHDVSGDSLPARKARMIDLRHAVLTYLNDVVGEIDQGSFDVFARDKERLEAE